MISRLAAMPPIMSSVPAAAACAFMKRCEQGANRGRIGGEIGAAVEWLAVRAGGCHGGSEGGKVDGWRVKGDVGRAWG